jgi:hypothetical protein
MHRILRAPLALAAMVPAACTTLQNQARVDPQTVMIFPQGTGPVNCADTRIQGDTRSGAFNVKCMTLMMEDGTEKLAYLEALKNEEARNRMGEEVARLSDRICIVEMGRLTGNEATANMLLSTATTAFSTIGALVKSGEQIFAGLAGVTNATRDHLRAEVYRNFFSYQIIKAIALNRATKLQAIRGHNGDTRRLYSVDRMLTDLDQYHQVCGLNMGFTLVDAAVSNTGPNPTARRDEFTAAINELELRINALRVELENPKLADAMKSALVAQRDALLAKQTELLTSRAAVATDTEEPTAAPTDDKPVVPPAPPPEKKK